MLPIYTSIHCLRPSALRKQAPASPASPNNPSFEAAWAQLSAQLKTQNKLIPNETQKKIKRARQKKHAFFTKMPM